MTATVESGRSVGSKRTATIDASRWFKHLSRRTPEMSVEGLAGVLESGRWAVACEQRILRKVAIPFYSALRRAARRLRQIS
jgi:hypothetical protein